MANNNLNPVPGPPAPAREHAPRAAVVLGLGLLPLTVGLSRHVGLSDLLGPAGGATLLVPLVTAAWVGVVGWGRTPRPVATLTLAGVAAAGYITVVGAAGAVLRGDEALLMLPAVVPILVIQTVWGFLAGVLALGAQRLRAQVRR